MKNTQNCRIGEIYDIEGNFIMKITQIQDQIIYETGKGYSINTFTNLLEVQKKFKYHPVLRRLVSMPTKTQVLAWGNPKIYDNAGS